MDPFAFGKLQLIQKRCVFDGEINPLLFIDDVNIKKDYIGLIIVELNEYSKDLLKSFGFDHLNFYVGTNEQYQKRIILLENVGLSEYQQIFLVLLCKGFWGLPKTSEQIENLRLLEKRRESEVAKTIGDNLLKVYEKFSTEEGVREGSDYFARDVSEIDVLGKVVFHFRNEFQSAATQIEVPSGLNESNIIFEAVLSKLKEILYSHYNSIPLPEILHDNSDEERKITARVYHIFCFRFVTLIKRLEIKEFNRLLSERKIYAKYFELLKATGYGFDFDPNVPGRMEAYFKKWHKTGQAYLGA